MINYTFHNQAIKQNLQQRNKKTITCMIHLTVKLEGYGIAIQFLQYRVYQKREALPMLSRIT